MLYTNARMLYTLIGLSVASAFVIQPVVQDAPGVITGNANSYSYAVDVNKLTSNTTFACLQNYDYQAVFIRCYTSYGSGTVDNNCAQNVYNARGNGPSQLLDIEVYMTPQPTGSKSAALQMSEMLTYLKNSGIAVRSVWVQVVSNPFESKWSSTWGVNTKFIGDLIQTAANQGVSVGIYTNYDEWTQITNNNPITVASPVMLWYYDVYGSGPSGESPANFDDFRPFGIFTSPTVKQFGQAEIVCSYTFNRDIYLSGAKAAAAVQTVGPVVGAIGF